MQKSPRLAQIKSKLLVLGAVNTTIKDQGCQNVTGRFESNRMLLNKPAGCPTFVQSHLTVKTVEGFKKNCHIISPPLGREKLVTCTNPAKIAQQDRMDGWIQSHVL